MGYLYIHIPYQLMQDFLHSIIAFPPVSMDMFRFTASWIRFFLHGKNLSKPREGLKVFGKLSLGGRNCLEDGNEYQDDITTVIISWRPENPGTKLLHLSHDCMLGMGGHVPTYGLNKSRWMDVGRLDQSYKPFDGRGSWIPSFFRRHYTRFFGESIVDSEIWKDLNVEDPLENLVWNYEWEVVEGWLQKNSWKSSLEKKTLEILPLIFEFADIQDDAEWFQEELKRKQIPSTQELNGHKEHCGYMIPGFFNVRIETCRYAHWKKKPKKTQHYGPPWIIPLRFLSPMRRKVSKITVKLAEWIPLAEFPGAMMCHNDETPVPKKSGSKFWP